MKVLIDIVSDHVTRHYRSAHRPEGVEDFGAADDTSVEYRRDNNFYYLVGERFRVPELLDGYRPPGDEQGVGKSNQNVGENPAKETGNGARKAQPEAKGDMGIFSGL